MGNVVAQLQSGAWITRERTRLWSLALLAASLCGLVFLLATSDGLNDYQNRPLGTDFSNIYAGGTYVLDGQPGTAFDPPSQHARQQMIFGKDTPFYGWCYPPFLLFVAAALALLPYAAALAVWQVSTMLLYLGMLWACCASRRRARATAMRCRAIRCGCCSPSRSRRCSSISATATTAFSPPR